MPRKSFCGNTVRHSRSLRDLINITTISFRFWAIAKDMMLLKTILVMSRDSRKIHSWCSTWSLKENMGFLKQLSEWSGLNERTISGGQLFFRFRANESFCLCITSTRHTSRGAWVWPWRPRGLEQELPAIWVERKRKSKNLEINLKRNEVKVKGHTRHKHTIYSKSKRKQRSPAHGRRREGRGEETLGKNALQLSVRSGPVEECFPRNYWREQCGGDENKG